MAYPKRPTQDALDAFAAQYLRDKGWDPANANHQWASMESAQLMLDPYFCDVRYYDENGHQLPRTWGIAHFLDDDGNWKDPE